MSLPSARQLKETNPGLSNFSLPNREHHSLHSASDKPDVYPPPKEPAADKQRNGVPAEFNEIHHLGQRVQILPNTNADMEQAHQRRGRPPQPRTGDGLRGAGIDPGVFR